MSITTPRLACRLHIAGIPGKDAEQKCLADEKDMEQLTQSGKLRWIKWIAALLLLIMFAVGIATTFSYGMAWDEGLEKEILLSNIREYAALFHQEHKVDILIKSALVGKISESVERDHGMAAYYPFFPVYAAISSQPLASMYAWHIYTFCIFFIGVAAVMMILKELFSNPLIWFGGTLSYFLTPRFFAESHYNNMDLTFISIILGMLLFLIKTARNPSWKNLIPYAFFSGLLMNCRTPGIAVWAFCGFFLVAFQVIHRASCVTYVKILGGFILSIVVYLMLTPASWGNPIEFLQYCLDNATHYTQWDKVIMYNGNMIQPGLNGLPYSYLPKWILMTVPEYVVMLFACSCATFGIQLAKRALRIVKKQSVPPLGDKDYFTGMLLLLFWMPFLFLVCQSPTLVLYNGWRHCYFLYAPIILVFLYTLEPDGNSNRRAFISSRIRKPLLCGVLILGMLTTTVDLIHFHPYEYVYFNRIARSTLDIQGFEGDYWNVSVIEAARRFEAEHYQGKKLKVALMVDAWGGQEEAILNSDKLQIVDGPEADYYLFTTLALNNKLLTQGFKLISGVEIDGYLISGVYVGEGD